MLTVYIKTLKYVSMLAILITSVSIWYNLRNPVFAMIFFVALQAGIVRTYNEVRNGKKSHEYFIFMFFVLILVVMVWLFVLFSGKVEV